MIKRWECFDTLAGTVLRYELRDAGISGSPLRRQTGCRIGPCSSSLLVRELLAGPPAQIKKAAMVATTYASNRALEERFSGVRNPSIHILGRRRSLVRQKSPDLNRQCRSLCKEIRYIFP